jgi:hypothetical protein
MSASEAAEAMAPLCTTPVAGMSRLTASHRLAVYIACTLVALTANYFLGKDLAWDTLNYHLYAGFSAVNDRFAQDYFAAGPPSYFNPYAFVPFYVMVSAGLSPLEISSALAVVQSVIFLLIFELAVCVCPSGDRRMLMGYGVCAVAIAFLNPILVQEIGSTFADVTTAEIVLAGWLLLAQSVHTPQTSRIVCAGLLLGAATALKLTNSVHAVSAFALFIMLPGTLWGRIRYVLGYATALGLGFAVASAPWSFRLDKMFGNPLFPLMNGVFRSPEFTTEPLRHFRFIPASFLEALWRPFAIVDPVPMVQEEMTAPDLRYALLVVLVAALFVRWMWKRLAHYPSISSSRAHLDDSTRVLAALGIGLAVDWGLWLSASGNGRYFVPMACVAAVVIVGLLFRLFAARPKVRNYALFAVLGIQIIQLSFGASYRWNWSPWDRYWLTVEMPEKLATEPNLYLTMGVQSNSFIASYLAKGSGLINFSGGYALGPEGATGARIEGLVHRYAPHLRVLWGGAPSQAEAQRHGHHNSQLDGALARFGLRIDASDCATIAVHGLPPEPEITYTRSVPVKPVEQPLRDTSFLTSCHVVPDDSDRSAQIARERAVDVVFDRVEDACPALFQPRRMRTENNGEVWRRLYLNTDLVMLIFRDSVRFSHPVRGGPMANLGRESDWAKGPLRLACGRRDGHYFASVLESKEE